ncbi:phage tail sheath C-terminal domain-containing protein [Desulfovibrio cuneatus]|uniref:phage tail sheath C-terminal domain-containing protein n=1 Tax=Desulfovibrio cuneatus TaxID=159728 RepID=UPI000417C3BF|nr:phage tail sheath C-terminal domain-containing protein [Desulfovibrio cuneatus]
MANNYLTPGIYVQEISTLPGVVVEVQSAIPAFIGYTEITRYDGRSLLGVPEHIRSFKDFEERFGGVSKLYLESIKVKKNQSGQFSAVDSVHFKHCFMLYETVYMYFANGGGECYIVSTGTYEETTNYDKQAFLDAIAALESVDDITLLVMPEAVLLGESCYNVQQAALAHCAKRMNRFAILDIKEETKEGSTLLHWRHTPGFDSWRKDCQEFRNRIGIMNLSYGAVYTPYIIADTPTAFSYHNIKDYLFDADAQPAAGETDNPDAGRLALADLDPVAKKSIQALDTALEDRANLMAAVEEAKIALSDPKSKKLPRFLSEVISKKYPVLTQEGIAPIAAAYIRLFASILGVQQEELKDVPEYTSFQAHTMSKDMVQHALDSLTATTAKYGAVGHAEDTASMLKELYTAIGMLTPDVFTELHDSFQELLFSELYSATSKNIDRLSDGLHSNSSVYRSIHSAVQTALRVQSPSAAMAGVYASTDRRRGVWKAPANVSLTNVLGLTQVITADVQESLNSDSVAGKSINALRSFPGQGYLVWGARTLDGNSQEWRYIPVRRFFITVEESVRRATTWAVFEPNDANLWAKVKGTIDNYLLQKWKEGALAGAAPGEAYFVNVGLGSTMTEQDILEGRLIVDIGMAVVRPAEFIILRFMHKMQQS